MDTQNKFKHYNDMDIDCGCMSKPKVAASALAYEQLQQNYVKLQKDFDKLKSKYEKLQKELENKENGTALATTLEVAENVSLWKRLSKEISDKNELLIEKNKNLENELASYKEKPKTYANIIKDNKRNMAVPPVIIRLKETANNDESADKLKTVMQQSNLCGELINKGKNKFIIKGQNEAELQQLKNKIVNSDIKPWIVETSQPVPKVPRIKITNIEGDIDINSLESSIISLNKINKDDFKLVYIRRNNTTNESTAIAEVKTNTYASIMKGKKLYIGWQRCPVYDDYNVNMCYRCCGYNHNYKKCTRAAVCFKCAGAHEGKECTKDESKACNNCIWSNQKNGTKHSTQHWATDKGNCALYHKRLEQQIAHTSYPTATTNDG